MRIFLGVFVLLLLALEGISRHLNLTQFKRMRTVAILVGTMAGFGTTVGNAAGPIMGIYLIMMRLDKKQLMWINYLMLRIVFFVRVHRSKVRRSELPFNILSA